MSKFSISPSLKCHSLDNILGMILANPGNHCEYISWSLLMSRSDSCLLGIVFAKGVLWVIVRGGFA